MNIKDFAEKFIKAEEAAFQRGEFDSLEKLESPDVVYHLPPPLTDVVGFEGHRQYIIDECKNNSGISLELEYLVGDGNVCVLSLNETVTLGANNPMSLPAGTTLIVDGLFVLRLEKGRVAEVWTKGSFTPKN